MSHDQSNVVESMLVESTGVRFSMRSMLGFMAITAVMVTVLSWFIRLFPTEARSRLWTYWGILITLIALVVITTAWRRYRAERKAGRVHFQLVPHSYYLPRAPRFIAFAMGTLFVAGALIVGASNSIVIAQPNQSVWMIFLDWPSALATFATLSGAGSGIAYYWWHGRISLGESGLVRRHEFLRWNELRRCYWDACYRDVVVMEFFGGQKVAARVSTDDRDSVDRLLKDKLPTKLDRLW